MRVKTQKARIKQANCGRCGCEINPGDQYNSAKPRYGIRMVRCAKPSCHFRTSELTTSKMAEAYAAQEDAEGAIADAASTEDIKEALTECAERFREVGQEYQESSDQWAGGNGHEEWQQKADELDGAADELDQAADEVPEDLKDEETGELLDLDDIKASALEDLANVSLP